MEMATLTNGSGNPKHVYSNGDMTQDQTFEPVAVVGMGELLLRSYLVYANKE